MGFRHLESFNEALLAKQVWRLLKVSKIVATQNLKTRYFPRTSIRNVRVSYNPIYLEEV